MRVTRDDRGFTVVELLIAIVILGIIMVPLADAVMAFLRNTDDTTRRLSESHDAQLSAAYFAQDVASIGTRNWTAYPYPLKQSVELNAPATGGLYPCGPAGTPAAVVRFAWDDPTAASANQEVRVAYVVQTVGGERQLHRIKCAGGSTTDKVLAHHVAATGPTVTCLSPTTCTAAAVPQSVTLTLTIQDPDSSVPYTVVLEGQRRQT
jgi:prepilin-type N-terminal cleavage/methylation domain-containing protein